MYGPPPNIRAVIGLMQDRAQTERWRQYMAMTAWGTLKVLRPKANVPMYQTEVHTAQDSRTGKEILEEIKGKMRRRLASREVRKTE